MAFSPDTTSMALFCDFENVALGVRETHHEKFDIKLVLERLLLKGSIVVKKAYCDWERYRGFKAPMHEANFELIEIPHVRQSGKNSADIRLVVDALDLCYTKSHVNTFVIISGDSDFSPLVSKLRENNKQVIGVGVKQSTSDLLTANCDEFIFYDDLVREVQRTSSRRAPPPPAAAKGGHAGNGEDERKRDELLKRRAKGVELAVQTLDALAGERADGSKIWSSMLKEAIKRRRPDFNESYFGFRGFSHLLEDAQARGLLELARDEKSNVYVTRSSAALPVSAEAATPAGPVAPAVPEVLPVTHRAGEPESRERGRRGRGRSRGGDRTDHAPEAHDDAARVEGEFDASDAGPSGPVVPPHEDAAAHAAPPFVAEERAPLAEDTATQEGAANDAEPARGPRRGARGARGRPAAQARTRDHGDIPVDAAPPPAAEAAAAQDDASAPPEKPARKRATGARKTPARPRAPRKTASSAE